MLYCGILCINSEVIVILCCDLDEAQPGLDDASNAAPRSTAGRVSLQEQSAWRAVPPPRRSPRHPPRRSCSASRRASHNPPASSGPRCPSQKLNLGADHTDPVPCHHQSMLRLHGKSSRKIAGHGLGSRGASAQLPRCDFGVHRDRGAQGRHSLPAGELNSPLREVWVLKDTSFQFSKELC